MVGANNDATIECTEVRLRDTQFFMNNINSGPKRVPTGSDLGEEKMQGQWAGPFNGNANGYMRLDIDEVPDGFIGGAVLHQTADAPCYRVTFRVNSKALPINIHVDVTTIDRATWSPISPEETLKRYGIQPATSAEVSFDLIDDSQGRIDPKTGQSKKVLAVSWVTNLGIQAHAELPQSSADEPSNVTAKKLTWKQFVRHMWTLETSRLIFRGQRGPWRLRTCYHRSSRAFLPRFSLLDMMEIWRRFSARLPYPVDVQNSDQFGALVHLAQHHGYPTPLLDWSYSPFVAAFFAYSGIAKNSTKSLKRTDRVRIYSFDRHTWEASTNQFSVMDHPLNHLSVLRFAALGNERMAPQQALSTVTNLDDIEQYIASQEQRLQRTLLTAYDLPANERDIVMKDLREMGITSGSLLPGFDGLCADLRELMFN